MSSFKLFLRSKKSSKSIEKNMKQNEKESSRTIRLLLLGTGEAGKTTILKQIQRIHKVAKPNELRNLIPYIKDAVVGYTKILCCQAYILHRQGEKTKVDAKIERLQRYITDLKPPYKHNAALADKISKLWADPAIKETLRLRSRYQIHDNVSHFLGRAGFICDDNYKLSVGDYLRIRTRSTGMTTERISSAVGNYGTYHFEFTDVGGQKSQRSRWLEIAVDKMDAVAYVIALSDYDLKCYEDHERNRFLEALDVFRDIIKGKYLDNKIVLILLNKHELFIKKIRKVPITVAFEDYPKNANPHNAEQVIEFVVSKFEECLQQVKDKKLVSQLHFHRISALDVSDIRALYETATLAMVQKKLRQSGLT